MDINETSDIPINRHPWELSRTGCVIKAIRPYLDEMRKAKAALSYINVGAGDCYFDQTLLKAYPQDMCHAVDIGYKELAQAGNIRKYHRLEQVTGVLEWALMMDSLEYIEDDVAFLNTMLPQIADGGYFFFTLPACPFLFSDYDLLIKNLRRYSRGSFRKVVEQVPGLKIVRSHNFYTLLFIIRLLEKICRKTYDPEQYLTVMWQHKEESLKSRCLTALLNMDFFINKTLAKVGIRLPGLSMLVVCELSKH